MDPASDAQQQRLIQRIPLSDDPTFDILDWYPAHQSCQRYFLDIAQYESGTQALCALINIRLPFQWLANPVLAYPASNATPTASVPFTTFPPTRPAAPNSPERSRASSNTAPSAHVSLIPYLRRLVITGFDKPAILHGLFGDGYVKGIGPHLDCERRNYLFSAKAGGWRSCKKQYDVGSAGDGDQTVPFMRPLDETRVEELTAAEKAWSDWLAMEDWMVGPRAPDDADVAAANNGGDSAMGMTNAQGTNGASTQQQ